MPLFSPIPLVESWNGSPAQTVQRILPAVSELRDNPRPLGSKKTVGSESTYRIRVGQYRAVYEVDDEKRIVLATRIRHRKDAYR